MYVSGTDTNLVRELPAGRAEVPFSAAALMPSAGITLATDSNLNGPLGKRIMRADSMCVRVAPSATGSNIMSRLITVGLAMLAGAALGAAAVQGLHAQAKPPIYVITEIDVTNLDAYTKDYAPKAQALIRAGGGRILAAGQNVTALEGEPPKRRVALIAFDDMAKIQAWRNSAEFKQNRTIGEKLAKFRSFTVEGQP